MAERVTAEERLQRLLWVLPTAAREGGASVNALAAELGIEPGALLRDIDEATTRAFHHPAGEAEPFTILIEAGADRDATIEVYTTGEFDRPARLTQREALAVALGLRTLAAHTVGRRDAALAAARRIEHDLAAPDVRAGVTRGADADEVTPPETAAIEDALADATVRHRRCRIRYIKPGDAPRERVVEPYRLVHASGAWYLLARDVGHGGVRCFRVDRIAGAAIEEDAPFEVPADFDPADHLSEDGAAFVAPGEEEVIVAYRAPAARWVAEATGAAPDPDGGVRVARRVADRRWLVRHVLAFGGAAEVIAPAALRAEVAAAARAIAGSAVAR